MNVDSPADVVPSRRRHLLSSSEWLLLGLLAIVQFTHIVDFMIMMPLGPSLIAQMKLTPSEFAHLVSAYSISAGIAGISAARFLDRFDRKQALLVLYAGFGAGTLLCALAQSYGVLLLGRAVAGAFGGVAAATVLATVGDSFSDNRRGMAMGVIMSAFSIASIAGVPMGILFANRWDWHAPFAFLAATSLLVLLLAAWVLPPLRGHMSKNGARDVRLWGLVRDPNHVRAFALTAAICVGSFTVFPFLATYLVGNVGLSFDKQLPFVYLSGGLVTLVTLALVGRASDRFGKLPVFRICAAGTIVAILLVTNLPASTSLPVVLTVTTFMMVVTSARMVPATALITNTAIPAERGGFMSLNAAVQHIVCGLAADFSGWMLNQSFSVGTKMQPIVGFWRVGIVASVATLASLWLAGRLRPARGAEAAPDEPVMV